MRRLLNFIFFLTFLCGFCQAQTRTLPQSLTLKFSEENGPLRRFLHKNFEKVEGTFIPFTFEGKDSVNLAPHPIKVSVSGVFLSRTEVSVKEYFQFYAANKGSFKGIDLMPKLDEGSDSVLPASFDRFISDKQFQDYPIVGVSKEQASAYCEWLGQQLDSRFNTSASYLISSALPTDVEMQLATQLAFRVKEQIDQRRSVPTQVYSTVSNFSAGTENKLLSGLEKVKARKTQQLGFMNLTGNVAEWVQDYPRDAEISWREGNKWVSKGEFGFKSPPGLKEQLGLLNFGMVKGGSFSQSAFYLQPGVSSVMDQRKGYVNVGFRPVIRVTYRRVAGMK